MNECPFEKPETECDILKKYIFPMPKDDKDLADLADYIAGNMDNRSKKNKEVFDKLYRVVPGKAPSSPPPRVEDFLQLLMCYLDYFKESHS